MLRRAPPPAEALDHRGRVFIGDVDDEVADEAAKTLRAAGIARSRRGVRPSADEGRRAHQVPGEELEVLVADSPRWRAATLRSSRPDSPVDEGDGVVEASHSSSGTPARSFAAGSIGWFVRGARQRLAVSGSMIDDRE